MASLAATLRGFALPRTARSNPSTARNLFTTQPTRTLRTAARRPQSFPARRTTPPPPTASRTWQAIRARLLHTSRPLRSAAASPATPHLTVTQRMKKLSREYGWSALGVYLMLSALDFPFCYLLVHVLGTERIGAWEHAVVSRVAPLIPESVKARFYAAKAWWHDVEVEEERDGEDEGWGVEEAQKEQNKEERREGGASLATQLALAYAIHKSFIFVRVPLTAAVTPKVVKVLRRWGWDIGKKSTKAERAARRAGKD